MTEISIDYDLGRHGRSSFRLTADDSTVKVGEFGYCTDALGDLVRAALLTSTSAPRAEARFDGEPFEWRLVADSAGGRPSSRLRSRILAFPDIMACSPETDGESVFEVHIERDSFARAVQKAAQAIWDDFGPSGYDEAWNGPYGFPFRALKALDAALAIQDPPAPSQEAP